MGPAQPRKPVGPLCGVGQSTPPNFCEAQIRVGPCSYYKKDIDGRHFTLVENSNCLLIDKPFHEFFLKVTCRDQNQNQATNCLQLASKPFASGEPHYFPFVQYDNVGVGFALQAIGQQDLAGLGFPQAPPTTCWNDSLRDWFNSDNFKTCSALSGLGLCGHREIELLCAKSCSTGAGIAQAVDNDLSFVDSARAAYLYALTYLVIPVKEGYTMTIDLDPNLTQLYQNRASTSQYKLSLGMGACAQNLLPMSSSAAMHSQVESSERSTMGSLTSSERLASASLASSLPSAQEGQSGSLSVAQDSMGSVAKLPVQEVVEIRPQNSVQEAVEIRPQNSGMFSGGLVVVLVTSLFFFLFTRRKIRPRKLFSNTRTKSASSCGHHMEMNSSDASESSGEN